MEPHEPEQLSLPGAPRRRARRVAPPAAAEALPVASLVLDVPLAHLDRAFDYLVPQRLDRLAQPGVRVRARFGGVARDGFVVERREATEHTGTLSWLDRVVSPEPVLTPPVLAVARTVAERWAGSLSDVLRLAVPPRHAGAEEAAQGPAADRPGVPRASALTGLDGGPALLRALEAGATPRAVWTPAPGTPWEATLAAVVAATLAGGRGALVVVPDARDVARLDHALAALLPAGAHVALTAELGPRERYARWLRVLRGQAHAVVGTRAAAFAPVRALGLVAVWDDGDEALVEPRAPYPHARDVLLLRAHGESAAVLVGGPARTAEAQALVEAGWARPLEPTRQARDAGPRVEVAGTDAELARDPAARAARLPSLAWRRVRAALAAGPVLVQVPRRGYAPLLACARCRQPARCARCAGPLGLASADTAPRCDWCGASSAVWACRACGGNRLRAVAVGAQRTAEELGRAFPGVPVRSATGEARLLEVGGEPALVVATPGAEPNATGGYAAALLLDGRDLLARPGLRAAEEALRRWSAAVALVRPRASGGHVVVVAESGAPAVQALVRGDPAAHAARELEERTELGLPPVTRVAAVTGPADAVAELVGRVRLPESAEVLGTVEEQPAGAEEPARTRAVLRVPRRDGVALAVALRAALVTRRPAGRSGTGGAGGAVLPLPGGPAGPVHGSVRVQLDPPELL